MSTLSAAVAGALLIGTGAQAATEDQLICDRPLSSAAPANCVLQSPSGRSERVAVVTSGTGQPVTSGQSSVRSSGSERVVIVSEPTAANAPVYIVDPSGTALRRGEQVVIVTEPVVVDRPRVIESTRGDAYPDPSPPSVQVEPRRSDSQRLDPSDTRDRALGRHNQP